MGKVAIFIDGAYLTKVQEIRFKKARIDFAKFSNLLANGMPILRTYYYNCLPYKSQNPTVEENLRFSKMQSFIDALSRNERFEARTGKLEFRGYDDRGKPIFQQKRVDVMLACDLALLSAKQRIDKAIVVTGDSDFLPAIELSKNEGVEFELVYSDIIGCCPHESLIRAADSRRILSDEDIANIKF